MSEILLRWLNDEVHLRNPVTDFETDFANGYAFGELLDMPSVQELRDTRDKDRKGRMRSRRK